MTGVILLPSPALDHIVRLIETFSITEMIADTVGAIGVEIDRGSRVLRAFGEAVNLVEPLRIRFWHQRGLTLAQVALLFQLHERDAQAVGELAEAMHVRPSTITGLTARLEQGGYVRRRNDMVDRRIVRVELTGTAFRVLDEIRNETRLFLGSALESLGEERSEQLAELLEALVETVSSHGEMDIDGDAVPQQAEERSP